MMELTQQGLEREGLDPYKVETKLAVVQRTIAWLRDQGWTHPCAAIVKRPRW
jgi:hypothetical protein